MKNLFFLLLCPLLFGLSNCGGSDSNASAASPPTTVPAMLDEPDDGKGVGEIASVNLNTPLQAEMVASGKAIYELKCAPCHRLTDQRAVGPGWASITEKRKPEWIMNMVLNVDVMLKEDSTARTLLEECLTRMPNQHLEEKEARALLEFMYANDGGKVGF